ncbi:MAG: RNA polymerase sigma factor [Myxococcota bacterium]
MAADDVETSIRRALSAGNLDAAATLALEAYSGELLGYLVSVLRNRDDAEDVYAEGCHRLWRGLPSFRNESSFRTWAYRIFQNALRMHMRRATRQRRGTMNEARTSALVVRERTETHPYQRTDAKVALGRLRATLGASDQALLTLRLDRRLSWRDVAVVLDDTDEPERAAAKYRKRFERVREQLRVLAQREGLL